MAKLVQKSGYIKSEKAGGYMKYIATREGVEKLTGNGPVTKGQRELIQKLLHDFPMLRSCSSTRTTARPPRLELPPHSSPWRWTQTFMR